jgi:hypothetical protein
MRLVLALAAGFLGYCYYRGHAAKSTHATVKEELRRWEDEGGNVPAVATPSPAPVPQSSHPAVDPVLRH